jgi:hypothetical protein
MDQADGDGGGAEHQVHVHVPGQDGVDRAVQHAIAAQDDGPGKDAHQRVRPERQDHQQEQGLARPAADGFRQHPGTGKADQHAKQR